MQDRLTRRVTEADLLKTNRARGLGNFLRVRGIDHVILAVEHLEASLCAGGGAFHRPRGVGEGFERLVEHEQIGAEDEQRAERERAGQDMQGAEVIHGGGAHDHECADDERAVHVREGEPQIRVKTLLRLQMKLAHLPFLAAEGVHHADRAQTFLRLREQGAFLFLDRGRVAANAIGEKVNRSHDRRHDGEGKQRQLPVDPDHDEKGPDQRNDGTKNVREALVVDRLDRLRIVGDAKTRIARAARVMIFQRERLQIGVKIGAQFEERLQAGLHENVIAGHVG